MKRILLLAFIAPCAVWAMEEAKHVRSQPYDAAHKGIKKQLTTGAFFFASTIASSAIVEYVDSIELFSSVDQKKELIRNIGQLGKSDRYRLIQWAVKDAIYGDIRMKHIEKFIPSDPNNETLKRIHQRLINDNIKKKQQLFALIEPLCASNCDIESFLKKDTKPTCLTTAQNQVTAEGKKEIDPPVASKVVDSADLIKLNTEHSGLATREQFVENQKVVGDEKNASGTPTLTLQPKPYLARQLVKNVAISSLILGTAVAFANVSFFSEPLGEYLAPLFNATYIHANYFIHHARDHIPDLYSQLI